MRIIRTTTLVLCCALLVSCGSTRSERALSGGGIGAGVGAAGAAVTGGSPVKGAIIGGGVGAATGALTKEEDINLGDFNLGN